MGGTTLIFTGAGPGGRATGVLTLLALLTLFAALVLTGCGGAGSGGNPSQASGEDERAPRKDEPKPEGKAEGSGGSTSTKRLGHPMLGDADAPVVLTEYSDYQ